MVYKLTFFTFSGKIYNSKTIPIFMGVWYDSSRDGTIKEYIEHCRNEMISKCFKGHEQFQQLVDLGYITPNITSIRIMYNIYRDDEFYGVINNFQLEGIILNAHSGKEGIHDPKQILSGDTPYFEVDMMNPNPEPVNNPAAAKL